MHQLINHFSRWAPADSMIVDGHVRRRANKGVTGGLLCNHGEAFARRPVPKQAHLN